ncbi:MAG TPA: lasso peptide biosynthesis B2 protein [Gemmatimonadaceae bacterium]
MNRVTKLLHKLATLSPREWVDLLQGQAALLAAQVLVWTRPTGQLVAHSAASAAQVVASDANVEPANMQRAQQLGLAVSRAGDYGLFRPLCLVRAVAVHRMLEKHRIRGGRIRIGVRMRRGRFGAHAWVEYGGQVVGDNVEHVGSFAELSEVQLVDAK